MTGTITRGDLVINLDDSITWNKLGLGELPMGGLVALPVRCEGPSKLPRPGLGPMVFGVEEAPRK